MSSGRVSSEDLKKISKDISASSAASGEASELEVELARFVISTLALEEITPEEIGPETPLFGGGVGLDSVDALELAVSLQKQYGIKLDPKDESSITALSSLRNLASVITEHRALASAS